jgi:hypothetical protein
MRRAIIRATVLAALVLSALGPATAQASHQEAWVLVNVHQGDKEVAAYGTTVGCAGDSCTVEVSLNNRDSGRFARWCGGNSVQVSFSPTSWGESVTCAGPSAWSLRVNVLLLDGDDLAAHGSGVTVTVVAQ